jgi:CDP-6-deoxy-D-xylo-4-hexulose-3-dehydrase
MNFKWPLINDNISREDKEHLAEFILNSNRFTNGPKVAEFEEVWSKWLGTKYSVMVGSGASANYITTAIVRELKGASGEVIVPAIGWISDVSSIINTGFVPVFVDVALETMTATYENIKSAINENTKAIVLVHALGFNGINERIIKIAKDNGLLLIEDCCEAHGAKYKGKKVGSIGDMSCFSFYFGHHMTTIEGGMICTNNEEIYQLARMFRSHGMTREASKKIQQKYYSSDLNPLFTFAVPGYNMRSAELNAVLGLKQIKRLDLNIQIRKKNLQIWLDNLNSDKYFTNYLAEGNSNFALPLIINPDTLGGSLPTEKFTQVTIERVCDVLEQEGVEHRIGTAGGGNQTRQPYLKKYNFKTIGNLDVANHIHDNGLYVGNHPDLTEQQITSLCEKLNYV